MKTECDSASKYTTFKVANKLRTSGRLEIYGVSATTLLIKLKLKSKWLTLFRHHEKSEGTQPFDAELATDSKSSQETHNASVTLMR